jgi:excisionase family DNA binding protein
VSGVLGPGHLLVEPVDAPALAALVRKGARSLAVRRLTAREAAVLMATEHAAHDVRAVPPADPQFHRLSSAPPLSVVSVEAASEVLQVSERYLRRLCRNGTLTAQRHGRGWSVDERSVSALAIARRAA